MYYLLELQANRLQEAVDTELTENNYKRLSRYAPPAYFIEYEIRVAPPKDSIKNKIHVVDKPSTHANAQAPFIIINCPSTDNDAKNAILKHFENLALKSIKYTNGLDRTYYVITTHAIDTDFTEAYVQAVTALSKDNRILVQQEIVDNARKTCAAFYYPSLSNAKEDELDTDETSLFKQSVANIYVEEDELDTDEISSLRQLAANIYVEEGLKKIKQNETVQNKQHLLIPQVEAEEDELDTAELDTTELDTAEILNPIDNKQDLNRGSSGSKQKSSKISNFHNFIANYGISHTVAGGVLGGVVGAATATALILIPFFTATLGPAFIAGAVAAFLGLTVLGAVLSASYFVYKNRDAIKESKPFQRLVIQPMTEAKQAAGHGVSFFQTQARKCILGRNKVKEIIPITPTIPS